MLPWTDWLTGSFFRIRISTAAADKLTRLQADMQVRLRQMLQDIAELADLVPPSTARSWTAGESPQLLQLQLGRVSVRYSIDEESRTLTVEHVVVPTDSADDLEKVG
jgi:hypothetical protein